MHRASLLRLVRRVFLGVLALIFVLLATGGGGLLWLRSSSGENWLRTEALTQLNAVLQDSGLRLEADALAGPLPERLVLRGLVVSDADGPWLRVDEARLDLDLAALLHATVRVRELAVVAPDLRRLPHLPPSPEPVEEEVTHWLDTLPAALPAWLPAVEVEDVRVERLRVPASLLGLPGETALFGLAGNVGVPHLNELRTRITVRHFADETFVAVTDTLNIEAALQLADRQLDLRIAFDESAGGLLSPWLPHPADVKLTLQGEAPLTHWQGRLAASVSDLADLRGDLGWTLAETTDLRLQTTLSPHASAPEIWHAALTEQLDFSADVQVAPGLLAVPRLRLTTRAVDVTAQDVRMATQAATANDMTMAGNVRVQVLNPALLAPVADLPFAAALLDLEVGGSVADPKLRLQAEVSGVRLEKLPAGMAAAGQGELPALRAAATVARAGETCTLDADAQVETAGTQALSAGLSTTLSGVKAFDLDALLASAQLSARLWVEAPRLDRLGMPDLAGAARLETTASGPLRRPEIHVELTSPDVTVAQRVSQTPSAVPTSQTPLAVPTSQVASTSQSVGVQDLKAALDVTFGKDLSPATPETAMLHNGRAVLAVSGHTLYGPLTLSADALLRDGGADISRIRLDGAGVQVSGGVRLLPDLRAEGELAAMVRDWAGLAALLPVPLDAQTAELRLKLSPENGQSATLTARVQELRAGEGGALAAVSSITLTARGRDLLAAPGLELDLRVGSGTAGGDTVPADAEPADGMANPGTPSGLRWEKADFSARSGFFARGGMTFSSGIEGATYGRVGEAYPLTVRLDGTLPAGGTALACRLDAEGLGLDPVRGTVNVPVRLQNGVPEVRFDGPLSGALRWKGALASLWRLVPLANTRVRGDVAVDITLGGTLNAPRPRGTIVLEKGLLQDLQQAVEVSNILARITLSPDGAGEVRLSGTDGNKGTFALQGRVGPAEEGFPLDIRGRVDKLMPLQRRDLRLSLSGDTRVTGTATAPDVFADITVDRGELRIENLPGGGIDTLDVVDGDAAAKATPGTADASVQAGVAATSQPAAPSGKLDVTVTVPARFYVRGHGIESEWRGRIRITGPLTVPAVAGDLSSIRGTLSFLGKTFVLQRGIVTLDGSVPPRPVLDVQVGYSQQDFTALITLSGLVTRPKLSLSSQPSLPTEEIVAQILFGRSTSGLGRGEALQLAATVASLSLFGKEGGGLLDMTRSRLGLDVLRFGSGGTSFGASNFNDKEFGGGEVSAEDTLTLEVGKYVLDNVYVGMEQGVDNDSTGIVVDVEVTPSLSIEARTTTKGSEVGVKWAWDY